MAATATRNDNLIDEKILQSDAEVFDRLQRALRDVRPLLEFAGDPATEPYDVTTTTRLTLTDMPLPNGASLRLP